MEKKHSKGLPWMNRAVLLAFMDALIISVSYLIALILRFDLLFSQIPRNYIEGYIWSMPFWIAATIVVFYAFRLYHSVWRLAGITEVGVMISAHLVLLIVYGAGILFMHLHMPRAYYFMGYILSFCLTTGMRFSYRLLRAYSNRNPRFDSAKEQDRIMVIGAGAAGQVLIRELQNTDKISTRVCCIIDDNPAKIGKMLEGVPIVGNRYDIVNMVKKYHINHIIYGFLTLTDDVEFRYKCDNVYNKPAEGGMRYDAPEVAVDWGTLLNGIEPVLSEKDKIGPTLNHSDNQFVYGENC